MGAKDSYCMKTKQEIVENWLPRYTERQLCDFTSYILLTNFTKYVEIFADKFQVPILGLKGSMPNASAEDITIINFGMGSSNAATIMDLLSAIMPKAVLFLGKCGGLKPINEFQKYRHSQHSLCFELFHQPLETGEKITGQGLFIRQTGEFGNTIMSLNRISN